MSTRCTIAVHDKFDTFTIYRHCDGYPDTAGGVLATLPEAFEFAWRPPRFEADDFAAAIVRAWKTPGGGNIYLTNSHDSHGDTEYMYDITQDLVTGIIYVTTRRSGSKGSGKMTVLWAPEGA